MLDNVFQSAILNVANRKQSNLFMKTRIHHFIARIAVFGIALVCAAGIRAASMPTTLPTAASDQENQFQFVRQGPEAEKLREAYQIMAWADHDYKGHRAKAMHATEEAGKRFGLDLKGEGRGHERQGVSNGQLRHARDLLIEVRDVSVGQKRVHKHVDEAIKQLGVALNIK